MRRIMILRKQHQQKIKKVVCGGAGPMQILGVRFEF